MKTILVTGGSSGIGRALTVRAARAGYAVYAVGRNMRALAAISAQISEEGGTITTDVTDVSDPSNAAGLIGRMLAAYGHVDVIVNNAGAVAVGPIAAQNDEALRTQFGTHVIGPLALVREALPSLRATRGHVFMIGSGVARIPIGGLGAYAPSKAALRSATTILRRELRALEIAVTYVDPGAVDTAFMSRAGLPGAPQAILVAPELVARKILLAMTTRPRVLNIAPLQTAAVAVAALVPALTEAILDRNPALIGAGPAIPLDATPNGHAQKLALPASMPLPEPRDDANDDAALQSAADPPAVEVPAAEVAAQDVPMGADAIEEIELAIGNGEATSESAEPDATRPTSTFDAAIEPLRQRMQRSKFSEAFVRELLVPDAVLDVGESAMRWAGMPNKHERSLTSEVFFALAEWGFLAPRADGRYRVVRPADESAV